MPKIVKCDSGYFLRCVVVKMKVAALAILKCKI